MLAKGFCILIIFYFSHFLFTQGTKKGIPDTETIPIGLLKMKEVGMYNVVFDIDHGDSVYDFDKFTIEQYNAQMLSLVKWVKANLSKDAKILVNFRDIMECLENCPERVFSTAKFLVTLPKELELFGLVFEDSGKSIPEEVGAATKVLRKIMDDHKFKGHLLTHVHEKFGFKDASTLEVSD